MNKMYKALCILLMLVCVSIYSQKAYAGFEVVSQNIVIAAADDATTETITMANSMIRDIVIDVPELDAGDTATFHLEVNVGDNEYKPRGWTDYSVGATDDDAVIKTNSSQLDILVDGTIDIGFDCSTAQAAERTIIVYILREY